MKLKPVFYLCVMGLSACFILIGIALELGYCVCLKYDVERLLEFPVLLGLALFCLAYSAVRLLSK